MILNLLPISACTKWGLT